MKNSQKSITHSSYLLMSSVTNALTTARLMTMTRIRSYCCTLKLMTKKMSQKRKTTVKLMIKKKKNWGLLFINAKIQPAQCQVLKMISIAQHVAFVMHPDLPWVSLSPNTRQSLKLKRLQKKLLLPWREKKRKTKENLCITSASRCCSVTFAML